MRNCKYAGNKHLNDAEGKFERSKRKHKREIINLKGRVRERERIYQMKIMPLGKILIK